MFSTEFFQNYKRRVLSLLSRTEGLIFYRCGFFFLPSFFDA